MDIDREVDLGLGALKLGEKVRPEPEIRTAMEMEWVITVSII